MRYRFCFLTLFCVSSICFGQEYTVRSALPVPRGYSRLECPAASYSRWIQNLPVKDEAVILDYRGLAVENCLYSIWEVVRMPLLFKSNLEQCADFAMRFWAEYHRESGKLKQLYLFDYGGRRKPFAQSGCSYNEFLRRAFANTNSHSLKQGCRAITADEVMPGDMFVQNERGGIGHVSVVMDVCQSPKGDKLYLVGYSFMPAQEFHIEKAFGKYGREGWFTLEGYAQYLQDFLSYGKPVLRRFE